MCNNNTNKVKIPFPKISFFIISSHPSLILFLFYSVIVSVLENPSLDPIHFCSISFTSHFTSHFISFSYPPNPFHHLFHNVTLTYLSNLLHALKQRFFSNQPLTIPQTGHAFQPYSLALTHLPSPSTFPSLFRKASLYRFLESC